MKLRDWRHQRKLTLAQCAGIFGMKHARDYHRYESGAILPDAPFVMRVTEETGGDVSAQDIYDQRHEWLIHKSGGAVNDAKEAAE